VINQPAQKSLLRGIGRWDLVAVAINGIIGAGIFGLPSKVFSLTGPYSLLAFVVCALVVATFILCFAEVGSRFSETGGPYLYAREAFGPVTGFQVGWLSWLARVTAFSANCNLLVGYLSYFLPEVGSGWQRAAVIITLVAALATVNIIGVRDTARLSNFFSVSKLVPLLIFITVGLFFLSPQSFSLTAPPGVQAFSSSVLLLVYAFSGFEMAVVPTGELREPHRNLPFGILTAIGVVAVFYILIQVVCVGTLPGLANSTRPLADASSQFLGPAGGAIIAAGALVSISGNLIVLILAGSRLMFAMAEGQELPQIFAAVHQRFRTPLVSILTTAGVMLVLTLSGTFIYAVTISTITRLLTYAATCAALPVLRRRRKKPAPFQIPAGVALSVVTLLVTAWLLSGITWREARDAGIAAAAGLVIYLAYRLKKGKPAVTASVR
jgi:amino acid transporter